MTKLTFALTLALIALTFILLFSAAANERECTCVCEPEATPALVIPVATMSAEEWYWRTVK